MAPVTWRIRDRSTFAELRRAGRRARRGPLAVTWLPEGAGPPRVAFAVDRRVGNAVARNRLRRRLLAAFRSMAADLPPGAYLLRPAPELAPMDAATLTQHLRSAIDAAIERP